MSFTTGDHVHVAGFGKGVVRQLRTGGRYQVEVKGRSIVVDASQVTAIEPRRRRSNSNAGAVAVDVAEPLRRAYVRSTIDLHGSTADEAVTALDSFLNDAILGGLSEVHVIHGRSGGRLRQAVHRRLQLLSSVRGFRVDPGNPGVTIVRL